MPTHLKNSRKAVVLFSGGLDSSTVLAYAKNQGFDCYPISFNYGQRHKAELNAAQKVAKSLGIPTHKIVQFPPSMFGSSALTNENIEVPEFNPEQADEIPVTYVPARNTIFLSIALGYAESLGAHDIFLGVSDVDYSGYPDCRPEFIQAFETLANLATKDGVNGIKFHIHAPLLHLSKGETIQLGLENGVDYSLTVSCYSANDQGQACGKCDSCTYRRKGFLDAGIKDPTVYQ
jgi:7-cyano-7-deazaguanine synthase